MNIQTILICIGGIALGIFLVVSPLQLNAYAIPAPEVPGVSVSPSCGPRSGFSVIINAKGFEPNGVLAWKLVDSDGNAPLIGYFHIDTNGKVKDTTAIDDVKLGHYKLQVGDDRNIDFKFDSPSPTPTQSNITIPCKLDIDKAGDKDNTHKTQKIDSESKCKIENEDKDHSKDNLNDLTCSNEAQNLNDVQQIFGDGGGEAAQSAQVANNETAPANNETQ